MAPRYFMVNRRESMRLSHQTLGSLCGCSEYTIRMLEEDERYVTHPLIVDKIAKVLKLTGKQAEMMLPKNYRPNDPEYDPDRYRLDVDWEHGSLPNGYTKGMMI